MKKYTIYHNPRCRKSREALQFLKETDHEGEEVRYLETPFTKELLQKVLNQITYFQINQKHLMKIILKRCGQNTKRNQISLRKKTRSIALDTLELLMFTKRLVV